MPKFVLNGMEKEETTYFVECRTTQYDGGDQEVVLEIDGEIVVSLVCSKESSSEDEEPQDMYVFKDTARAQGFEVHLEEF